MAENKKITIADIAEALKVSKTTVSRAISGKGRIGEETKQKVLEYIEKYNYKPNVLARGLAQSKTYNICITLPNTFNISELPFFQKNLLRACDYLSTKDYDVIVTKISDTDVSNLSRVIENQKVDGVILTSSTVDGIAVNLLREKEVPFVLLGSCQDSDVYQIDAMHYEGCKELTAMILSRGNRRLALLGGNTKLCVTKHRKEGFLDAHKDKKVQIDRELIYANLTSNAKIEKAVLDAIYKKADCLVCMDDNICFQALKILKINRVNVPTDVQIVSFFGSSLLDGNHPSITSIEFDNDDIGTLASRTLLAIIMQKKGIRKRVELGYRILMNDSIL